MSVRKSSTKGKAKRKNRNKVYPRKGVKPAKIETKGVDKVEVVYDKSKDGDVYSTRIKIRELDDRDMYLDIIGFNKENLETIRIEQQPNAILISSIEKDRDTDGIILVITDDILRKSNSPMRVKKCGHACNSAGGKCCFCQGRGQCLQCGERGRIMILQGVTDVDSAHKKQRKPNPWRDSHSRFADKYDIERVKLSTDDKITLIEPIGELTFIVTSENPESRKLKKRFDEAIQ